MFARELRQGGHTRRFVIADAGRAGWEVRIEEDSRIVRRTWYADWHRVERAEQELAREVRELKAVGWTETPTSYSTNL